VFSSLLFLLKDDSALDGGVKKIRTWKQITKEEKMNYQ